MNLSEISAEFGGLLRQDGRFETLAFGTSQPESAFLTFLEKERFLQDVITNTQAACVLTTQVFAQPLLQAGKGVLVCDAPRAMLFAVHNALLERGTAAYAAERRPTVVGADCHISPLASIPAENIVIGDRVTIEPFVTMKGRVTIGSDCTIRVGAVIGGKGFSFAEGTSGERIGVLDGGEIVLEDNCEVFELAQISTPPFPWERTWLGQGVKMDAQTHVGHGAHIGAQTLVAEGGRVCGNARIGHSCWIGVGAIVSNRVSIGDGARVSIGAVATKDVPAQTTVSGNFAIEHQRFLQNLKQSLADEG